MVSEQEKEYQRQYRKAHPEVVRKAKKKYRKDHPEKTHEYAAKWYRAHRDELLTRHKELEQKRRKAALEHYGGNPPRCRCCGESEIAFLQLDHMYGGGKAHSRAINGHSLARWLVQNNFPTGFQVLCANCNIGKYRNGGVCPHYYRQVATSTGL